MSIASFFRPLRLFVLKRSIRFCELNGLAVVQVKRVAGTTYLVARSGTYARIDKVKLR